MIDWEGIIFDVTSYIIIVISLILLIAANIFLGIIALSFSLFMLK